jgi:hypothetical protein
VTAAPSPVTATPSPEKIATPPILKRFFVTVEENGFSGNSWVKKFDIHQPVFVVTNLTKDETVRSFVNKLQEQESKAKKVPMIERDKTWRVYFPNNLPNYLDWKVSWEKRQISLLT